MADQDTIGGLITTGSSIAKPVEDTNFSLAYNPDTSAIDFTPLTPVAGSIIYLLRMGPPGPRGVSVSNSVFTSRPFSPVTHESLWLGKESTQVWDVAAAVAAVDIDGARSAWTECVVTIDTSGTALTLVLDTDWTAVEVTTGATEGLIRFTVDSDITLPPGTTLVGFAGLDPYDANSKANYNAAAIEVPTGVPTDVPSGGVRGELVYAGLLLRGPGTEFFREAGDVVKTLNLAGITVAGAPTQDSPPSYTSGVTANVARIGTAVVLNRGAYTGDTSLTSEWYVDGTATGDTDTSFTPLDAHDGLTGKAIVAAIASGGATSLWNSPTFSIAYTAPTVSSAISNQTAQVEAGGFLEINLAGRVTGSGLSYSITTGAGTLDTTGGQAIWRHSLSSELAITPQNIRVSNSGGAVNLGFNLTINQGTTRILAGSTATGTATPAVIPARSYPDGAWVIGGVAARATSPVALTFNLPMVRRTSLVTSGTGSSAMGDTNGGVTSFAALNVAAGSKWVSWSAGILTGSGVTVVADYEQQDTTVPLTLTGGLIGDMAVMMIAHNGTGISSTPTAQAWEPLLSQASNGGGGDCSCRIAYRILQANNEAVPAHGTPGLGRHVTVYRLTGGGGGSTIVYPSNPTQSFMAVTEVTSRTEAEANGFPNVAGKLKRVVGTIDPTITTASGDFELVFAQWGEEPSAALTIVAGDQTLYSASTAYAQGFTTGSQVTPKCYWKGVSGAATGLYKLCWTHDPITIQGLEDTGGGTTTFPTIRSAALNDAMARPLTRGGVAGAGSNNALSGQSALVIALDVYARGTTSGTVWQRAIDQAEYSVQPGQRHEPGSEAGYPMQHYNDILAFAVVCKRTPSIWNRLAQDVKDRWDTVFMAMAVAAAYGTADAHPSGQSTLRHNLRGVGDFGRGWAPNFSLAPIATLQMAVAWWGTPGSYASGSTAVTNKLNAFNMASFSTLAQSQGLLNIYDTFRRPLVSTAPTAAQVETYVENWKYTQPLSNQAHWTQWMRDQTLSKTVARGLASGAGQICADGVMRGCLPSGAANSPVHGQVGMFHELGNTDNGGTKTGTGGPVAAGTVLPNGRSSTHYSISAPRFVNDAMVSLLVSGMWNSAGSMEQSLRTRANVGWIDYLYKVEKDYLSRANGGPKRVDQGLTISGISQTGTGSPARDPDGWSEWLTQFGGLYTEFLWKDVVYVALEPP